MPSTELHFGCCTHRHPPPTSAPGEHNYHQLNVAQQVYAVAGYCLEVLHKFNTLGMAFQGQVEYPQPANPA